MPGPLVAVNDLGAIGIIADILPHTLPLNAWSNGKNVRMRDGMVEKFLGHQAAFTAPPIVPYFMMPVNNAGTLYWILAGLTKIYVWDGNTWTNITRQTAFVDVNYNAGALLNWTGGVLGGLPILNNGVDNPQSWFPGLANKCTDLVNWPAATICAAMRPFKRHLVAMNVTKAGVAHPQMVKWSHPAVAGAVPVSWDQTDATKDAGEYEILDTNGAVVDGLRMRDSFVLYKADSVHLMQYVGGQAIFNISPLFDSFGILSRRCAVEFQKGVHAVFALGDLIVHDGATWKSIGSKKMKRWLFNQIDKDNFSTSFVGWNPSLFEVWFCFPTSGNSLPNQALVWNYVDDTFSVRDLNNVTHIATGNVVISNAGNLWDGDAATWDSDSSVWDSGLSNPSGLSALMADAGATQMMLADSSNQFNGVSFSSFIERTGLPLPVSQDGPPDMRSRKLIRGIYPRIEGTVGQQVDIFLGTQDAPGGPVDWLPNSFPYIIGTTRFIDCRINTVMPAIRFQSAGNFDWRLAGVEYDVKKVGNF
jgi:hypothetical protein